MGIQDARERAALPDQPPLRPTVEPGRGITERWHDRISARKRAGLLSARKRRNLVSSLRRTAQHTPQPHTLLRRRRTPLPYRVAVARNELLELAAILEHGHHPDPECLAALQDLLAKGRNSPLRNAEIPVGELHAALHHVRAGLGSAGAAAGYPCTTKEI